MGAFYIVLPFFIFFSSITEFLGSEGFPYGSKVDEMHINDVYDNQYGNGNGEKEEVVVMRTPEFVTEPKKVIVNEGDTLRLPCIVDRLDVFVLIWMKNADIITVGSKIFNKVNGRIKLEEEQNGNYLVISSAEENDAGEYVCQISALKPAELKHSVEIRGMNNTLDDILSEMSLMRSDMDTKMSEIQTEMDRMDKLIHQVEEVRDLHFLPPTIPTATTLPIVPTPTTPLLNPSACHSYVLLADPWRHIDYANRGSFPTHCDKTGRSRWTTYTSLDAAWYRFTGAAGTKLPTAPAPVGGGPGWRNQICGTMANAYILSGGNPTVQEGIVTRDVCFELGRFSCWWNTTVKAAACKDIHGDYVVYELQPVADCNFAYCALD